ncbi:MAG: Maf family protein, partial [Caldisericia bacterium]|nr:Maf family protein [Caldisericia bacterium]
VRKNAVGKNLSAQTNDLPSSYCLISSDTIVVWNHTILGKPANQEEAIRFLRNISGTRHEVLTGVSIRILEKENRVHRYFVDFTAVQFQPLTNESIQAYTQIKDPLDKAGAYGIQEIPSDWVQEIQGDLDNVIGLPVKRLKEELMWLGRYFTLPILQP